MKQKKMREESFLLKNSALFSVLYGVYILGLQAQSASGRWLFILTVTPLVGAALSVFVDPGIALLRTSDKNKYQPWFYYPVYWQKNIVELGLLTHCLLLGVGVTFILECGIVLALRVFACHGETVLLFPFSNDVCINAETPIIDAWIFVSIVLYFLVFADLITRFVASGTSASQGNDTRLDTALAFAIAYSSTTVADFIELLRLFQINGYIIQKIVRVLAVSLRLLLLLTTVVPWINLDSRFDGRNRWIFWAVIISVSSVLLAEKLISWVIWGGAGMPQIVLGEKSVQTLAYAFPDDDLGIIDVFEAVVSMMVMIVDFIFAGSVVYSYVKARITYNKNTKTDEDENEDGDGEYDTNDGDGMKYSNQGINMNYKQIKPKTSKRYQDFPLHKPVKVNMQTGQPQINDTEFPKLTRRDISTLRVNV